MSSKFTAGGWGPVPQQVLEICPKINVSGLKSFNTSPAYFESMYVRKEIEKTKAMDLGTKLHYAILEPDKFEMLFVEEPQVIPDYVVDTLEDLKRWCANEGLKTSGTKAELTSRLIDHGANFMTYDDFMNDYLKGRQVLKPKEALAAKRIIERIKSIPSNDKILTGGETEKLGWVIHAETNVVVSFRIDYFKKLDKTISGYNQLAIDLKTTNSLSTSRDLQNFISKDDTHIQAAFYVDALEYLTGLSTAFAVFAVETSAPYTVMMQILGNASVEVGRADYEKNIRTFLDCYRKNHYPTGFENIGTVELSSWKLSEIENREAKALSETGQ